MCALRLTPNKPGLSINLCEANVSGKFEVGEPDGPDQMGLNVRFLTFGVVTPGHARVAEEGKDVLGELSASVLSQKFAAQSSTLCFTER